VLAGLVKTDQKITCADVLAQDATEQNRDGFQVAARRERGDGATRGEPNRVIQCPEEEGVPARQGEEQPEQRQAAQQRWAEESA